MSWVQLKLLATRDNAEQLEDALLGAGAVSVTLQDNADQPVYEPAIGEQPIWDDTLVTGLFNADTDEAQLLTLITAQLGAVPKGYKYEILEDKDWEREWMDRYEPIRCGQKLWICPSWKTPEDEDAVNLMLDPGLAFGTGTHPTTFLCLQWLDNYALTQSLASKTVIDYGCGSGILGIAALLLGAEKVIGVDNDPQAIIASRDNAQRNGVAERMDCYLPDELPAGSSCDILLANILAGPLLSLQPLFAELSKPGTELVLSGIIAEQGETIREHYGKDFQQLETVQHEQWLRISGRR